MKISQLKDILFSTDEFDIYTVVVMAKRDIENGYIDSAISRLKVDIDKLRDHKKLIDFINDYDGNK